MVRIAHVLGASMWVGSLVYFAYFFRPVAESTLEGGDLEVLVDRSGRRLGFFIAGVLVPLQLFTGLALLYHRGFKISGGGPSLYGKLIYAKVIIFFIVVGISAVHGIASSRQAKNASKILAYLALAGSLTLAALGAALVP